MDFSVNTYTFKARVKQKITFAFASDLHNRATGAILRAIRESEADALLIGGDLIHEADEYQNGFAFLSAASRHLPVFLSIGNHDRRFRGDLVGCLTDCGATVLDNRSVLFGGVRLGGLSSAFLKWGAQDESKTKDYTPDLSFLCEYSTMPEYKLLLCHHPEYYERYIRALRIDLTLAGHAHGGQWRFFGRGVFAPGQGLFPRYTSGLYEHRLLVSRGMVNAAKGIPRINNRPELLIVRLIPENKNASEEKGTSNGHAR